MKEKKEMPNWLCGLIISFISIIFLGSLIVLATYPQRNYEKACSNVPSESWFEQDLKITFYDKEIKVLDIESNESGEAVVKVEIYYEKEKIVHYCYYKIEEVYYGKWQWSFQETL